MLKLLQLVRFIVKATGIFKHRLMTVQQKAFTAIVTTQFFEYTFLSLLDQRMIFNREGRIANTDVTRNNTDGSYGSAFTFDQRGCPRSSGPSPDIGAVELQEIRVDTIVDEDDGIDMDRAVDAIAGFFREPLDLVDLG